MLCSVSPTVDVQKMNVDWTKLEYFRTKMCSSSAILVTDYEGNSTSGSFSNTSFAMALGGGLDINVNDIFRYSPGPNRLHFPTFREFNGTIHETEDR